MDRYAFPDREKGCEAELRHTLDIAVGVATDVLVHERSYIRDLRTLAAGRECRRSGELVDPVVVRIIAVAETTSAHAWSILLAALVGAIVLTATASGPR